jgi:hypothetical protein
MMRVLTMALVHRLIETTQRLMTPLRAAAKEKETKT